MVASERHLHLTRRPAEPIEEAALGKVTMAQPVERC